MMEEEEMKINRFKFPLENWYSLYLYKVEQQKKFNKFVEYKKKHNEKWKRL